MKNEQWEAIQVVFEKMEQACAQLESAESLTQAAAEPYGETPTGEAATAADQSYDIVGVRSEIRTQLDFLRVKLAETLTERDCYLVLFPLVAFFDEHVQTRYLQEYQMSWPPLQKELFQIDDAGELFYDTVDDLLRKPQTIPFIYEVYYFCLNQGFQGRYVDNPVKINEYMKKLREKIPVVDLASVQIAPEESGQIKLVGSAMWYYLSAAAVLVLCYFLLLAFSRHWDSSLVGEDINHFNISHKERSVVTEAAALPEQKGLTREWADKRRRIMVRPILHTRQKPEAPWEELTSPVLKGKVVSPPQSPEKTQVPPAPQIEIPPQQGGKLPSVYSVQVASFTYRENSLVRLQELTGRGFEAWLDLDTRGGYHRVLVGKYKERGKARSLFRRLKEKKEFQDAILVKVSLEVPPAPQIEIPPQQGEKLPYVYSVQVSSFKYRKTALNHLRELEGRHLEAWLDLDTRGGYHRVLVGKYRNKSEALALLDHLRNNKEFEDALPVKVSLEDSSELVGNP
jgi:type IV/VI secretion system ImpK/VasF family protein